MRSLLLALSLVGLATFGLQPSFHAAQVADAPRLVVILVVDQLRTDYLTTPSTPWRAGFARLLREGAFFPHAEYPYMNTVTCAGHATIGTGTYPRTHGMVLNGWWDRQSRSSVACTDDTEAPHISYRTESPSAPPAPAASAAAETAATAPQTPPPGDSGRALLVNTLADELRLQRPGSRVVTLSLKARSAIGLAGHAGTAVTWASDTIGHFVTSTAFAPDRVDAVARFLDRHTFEGDASQMWTLRDPAATYARRDSNVGATPQQSRTGLFPHRIAGPKGTDAPFFTLWQASPFSDAYLGRMAAALISDFKLGQRDTTDFLGVSFSALDLIGHSFGPESREVEDMLRRLDDTVGALIDSLDAQVGPGRWVLGFSSDHGVAPIAGTSPDSGRIFTQDVRERIEETLMLQWGARAEDSYVASVTYNNVYLAEGIAARLQHDTQAYEALEQAVLDIPGLVRLIRADHLSPAAQDPIVRSAALSHHAARSGDIVLVGRPGWYFASRGSGGGTTHGTGHPYDQQVPVVLLGAGVRAGQYPQRATPADIAPTLAHVAGLRLPDVDGRVLREALR
jgi:predicted AlkP superfamily pyrophosphatase or phosphodiesterase